jgi:hypothetical protein
LPKVNVGYRQKLTFSAASAGDRSQSEALNRTVIERDGRRLIAAGQ